MLARRHLLLVLEARRQADGAVLGYGPRRRDLDNCVRPRRQPVPAIGAPPDDDEVVESEDDSGGSDDDEAVVQHREVRWR